MPSLVSIEQPSFGTLAQIDNEQTVTVVGIENPEYGSVAQIDSDQNVTVCNIINEQNVTVVGIENPEYGTIAQINTDSNITVYELENTDIQAYYNDVSRQHAEDAQAAQSLAELAESGAQTAELNAKASELDAEAAASASQTAQNLSETAQSLAELAESGAQTAQSLSEAARDASQTARTGAETAEAGAIAARDDSITAQLASEAARDASQTARTGAETAESNAQASATAANSAKVASQTAQANAETAQSAAETSASSAASSASSAASSASSASTDADRAEAAANTAVNTLSARGDWDASTGVYPTPTANSADFYQISVAGTMTGSQGSMTANIGDQLYWNVDKAVWYKIDNTDHILSVNGQEGAVVLDHTDVGALGATQNAVSASKWQTARTLTVAGDATGAVSIDGSSNATLNVDVNTADKWSTPRTISLTGDVSGSVSIDGSSNVSLTTTVAGDSHLHSFNQLVNKEWGTGLYSTTGNLESGRGSGGVALTINDGHGNANITFNHMNGIPEQDGNALRIETNTDSSTDATFTFEAASGVTGGVSTGLTELAKLSESAFTYRGNEVFTANNYTTLDNRYVDKTSAQIISGIKTFNDYTLFSGPTWPVRIEREVGDWGLIRWQQASGVEHARFGMTSGNEFVMQIQSEGTGGTGAGSWIFKNDGSMTSNGNIYMSATQSTAVNALTRKDYVDGLTASLQSDIDTHTHDDRYYTEAEADSRFVNTTGDSVTGELISTIPNAWRIVTGQYGFFTRNDGSNTYFMTTAAGDQYGTYSSLRPIIISNSTGKVTLGHDVLVNGTLTATLNGNASSASKWATARTLTIGNTGKSVNGTANVAWSLSEIGALAEGGDTTSGTYLFSDSRSDAPTIQVSGSQHGLSGIALSGDGVTAPTGTALIMHSGSAGSLAYTSNAGADYQFWVNYDGSAVFKGDVTVPTLNATNANITDTLNTKDIYLDTVGYALHFAGDGTKRDNIYWDNSSSANGYDFRLFHDDLGDLDFISYNGGVVKIDSNVIWHAGNDGSGSGLDADKVDGLQASQFMRADTSDTFDVGRGVVYWENNAADSNGDIGAGVTIRASANPSDGNEDSGAGSIFAVRSSGQATRLWVGQSVTSTGDNDFETQSITALGTVTAPTFSGSLSGNASTASSWNTARRLTLSGNVSGSVSFNGSSDFTLTTTVKATNVEDTRATSQTPNTLAANSVTAQFTNLDRPSGFSSWYSALSVKGWGDGYQAWQLLGGSNSSADTELYFRRGIGTSWNSTQRVFMDDYHPNADKWTTARTITLAGDASGSVSIDGSANKTLTVTVANDSHTHDGRYFTESESDARYLRGNANDTATGDINFTGNLTINNPIVIGTPDGGNAMIGTVKIFTNDGGGNSGIRFGGAMDHTVGAEDGSAWEIEVDNDSANSSMTWYTDSSVSAGGETVSYAEKMKLESNGDLSIQGSMSTKPVKSSNTANSYSIASQGAGVYAVLWSQTGYSNQSTILIWDGSLATLNGDYGNGLVPAITNSGTIYSAAATNWIPKHVYKIS